MSEQKVLLIEANDTDAEAMRGMFASVGFSVVRAGDGRQGLELAKSQKPSLIVLAVELPGLSGYIACKNLKRDASLSPIPLIITSSTATDETFAQHQNLKTRAEEYLRKPFDLEQLKTLAAKHVTFVEGDGAAAVPESEVQLFFDDPSNADIQAPEEELLFVEPGDDEVLFDDPAEDEVIFDDPAEDEVIFDDPIEDEVIFDDPIEDEIEVELDDLAGNVAAAIGDLDEDLFDDDESLAAPVVNDSGFGERGGTLASLEPLPGEDVAMTLGAGLSEVEVAERIAEKDAELAGVRAVLSARVKQVEIARASIHKMRQERAKFRAAITSRQDAITRLQGERNALKTKVEELNATNAGLEKEVDKASGGLDQAAAKALSDAAAAAKERADAAEEALAALRVESEEKLAAERKETRSLLESLQALLAGKIAELGS